MGCRWRWKQNGKSDSTDDDEGDVLVSVIYLAMASES